MKAMLLNRVSFGAVLVLTAMAVGCGSSVNPIVESDRPFTLWGWLDPTSDLQKVRLFEIKPVLGFDDAAPSTAMVTMTDMESGVRTAWRDSLVQFDSGLFGHVFIADTRVDYDRVYRLAAMHVNGEVSEVTISTPPRSMPVISDVQSVRGNVRVRMDWKRAPRILDVYVVYHVTLTTARNPDPKPFNIVLQAGTVHEKDDGTYSVIVEPSFDIGSLYGALNVSPGGLTTIELLGIDVRPFVAAGEWTSPSGSFDPELLVQPGTLSNVQNGFGFVSAGYEDSFVIQLADDAARNAGFTVR